MISVPEKVPSPRIADTPAFNVIRYEAALTKLGIDPEELRKAPPLTDILKNANGGLDSVIEAMRFSHDPSVEAFLAVYDRSTHLDRRILPWEAYAILAELDMTQLLGAIMLALRQYSVKLTSVISMTHHPDTIRTRVAEAKKPEGWRDRDALDRALGFAPVPKGQTINLNFGAREDEAPSERGVESGDIDVDYLFPTLSETQKDIDSAKDGESD